MCDYSLSVSQSRSAEPGERLVVHRFSNGVKGFVSYHDALSRTNTEPGFWSRRLRWLWSRTDDCAVCLRPGARLIARDLPDTLRAELKLASDEEVTLCSRGVSPFSRDAVRFREGPEILVQWLPEGLIADVLSLPFGASPEDHPTHSESVPSLDKLKSW